MPPEASSKQPARRSTAPVKAPFSWPKISLSISVSGMAAQLTATKGRALRGLRSCSVRATSSLPVPLSPVIEHRHVGRRDLLDQAEDLAHRRRAAHQRAQHAALAQPPPRHFQLDCGLALPRGVGQDGAQARGVHRLLQKVVRAQLHGVHGQLNGPHGGEHHHGQVGVQPRCPPRTAWSAGRCRPCAASSGR